MAAIRTPTSHLNGHPDLCYQVDVIQLVCYPPTVILQVLLLSKYDCWRNNPPDCMKQQVLSFIARSTAKANGSGFIFLLTSLHKWWVVKHGQYLPKKPEKNTVYPSWHSLITAAATKYLQSVS